MLPLVVLVNQDFSKKMVYVPNVMLNVFLVLVLLIIVKSVISEKKELYLPLLVVVKLDSLKPTFLITVKLVQQIV